MKILIVVISCSFLLAGVACASSLPEQNKALAKRAFEELLSKGKFELAERLYAKDFVNHGIHRDALVVVIFRCAESTDGAAMDDNLRIAIARRLKEHGVHIARGLNAGGLGLQRLSAAHFPTIGTHRAIQGHVLWLEGRHTYSASVHHPAETCDQRAFAGI